MHEPIYIDVPLGSHMLLPLTPVDVAQRRIDDTRRQVAKRPRRITYQKAARDEVAKTRRKPQRPTPTTNPDPYENEYGETH